MKELNNILTSARNSGDVGLILDKEEELDQVCRQEADKIAGFRLFNEEKPTRAMISLEKKIGGYCNINKINQANLDYIPLDKGGAACQVSNPKMILLSNPKPVRDMTF